MQSTSVFCSCLLWFFLTNGKMYLCRVSTIRFFHELTYKRDVDLSCDCCDGVSENWLSFKRCLQICRFLGSVMTERSGSQTSSGCLILMKPAFWRFLEFSLHMKESIRVLPKMLQEWSRLLPRWILTVSSFPSNTFCMDFGCHTTTAFKPTPLSIAYIPATPVCILSNVLNHYYQT